FMTRFMNEASKAGRDGLCGTEHARSARQLETWTHGYILWAIPPAHPRVAQPLETHDAAIHLGQLTRKGHRYLGIPAPCEGAVRWKSTGSGQSADALLLATAVAHGCRLVTFDTGIALASVTGALREHLVV